LCQTMISRSCARLLAAFDTRQLARSDPSQDEDLQDAAASGSRAVLGPTRWTRTFDSRPAAMGKCRQEIKMHQRSGIVWRTVSPSTILLRPAMGSRHLCALQEQWKRFGAHVPTHTHGAVGWHAANQPPRGKSARSSAAQTGSTQHAVGLAHYPWLNRRASSWGATWNVTEPVLCLRDTEA